MYKDYMITTSICSECQLSMNLANQNLWKQKHQSLPRCHLVWLLILNLFIFFLVFLSQIWKKCCISVVGYFHYANYRFFFYYFFLLFHSISVRSFFIVDLFIYFVFGTWKGSWIWIEKLYDRHSSQTWKGIFVWNLVDTVHF